MRLGKSLWKKPEKERPSVLYMNDFYNTFWRKVGWNTQVLLRGLSAFALGLLLTGCNGLIGPGVDDPAAVRGAHPNIDKPPVGDETVRGSGDPPVVTLQMGKTLHQANLRHTEALPGNIQIGATNLNNVPVTVAMQAVLADTDITLLWETPELQKRMVTLMNLKGALPKVVDRICRAAKIICAYRNGALEMMDEDTFIVEMPGSASAIGSSGASSAKSTIADSIEALIDGKVKVDETGGNLIYTTNAEGHERVQSYLEELRNGRPLIVLQLYIWQVDLNDNKSLGVNWSQLNIAKIGGSKQRYEATNLSSALTSVTGAGAVSLGAVFSGAIDASTVVGFLSTQGKVQNISSPQLTFVSGTSAKFEVGNKQSYIAQVGTILASSVSGTSTPSTASNNTISTQELKTGLSVTVQGNYENGVVFATMEIKTSDLIALTSANTPGVDIQLPQTSDRQVDTVLRVRPGDSLVLAGLQSSQDTRTRQGLPLFGNDSLPLYGNNHVINSELVIMVKPSIVFFNDRNELEVKDAKIQPTPAPPPVHAVADQPAKPEPVTDIKEQILPAEEKQSKDMPVQAVTEANKPPVEPSALQNEFGTVVKLYEDTQVPPKATAPPTLLSETVPEKTPEEKIQTPDTAAGGVR